MANGTDSALSLRLIARVAAVAAVLAAFGAAAADLSDGKPAAPPQPNRAIVNGRHIQPNAKSETLAGNPSPTSDSRTVDELYEQVMRASQPRRPCGVDNC